MAWWQSFLIALVPATIAALASYVINRDSELRRLEGLLEALHKVPPGSSAWNALASLSDASVKRLWVNDRPDIRILRAVVVFSSVITVAQAGYTAIYFLVWADHPSWWFIAYWAAMFAACLGGTLWNQFVSLPKAKKKREVQYDELSPGKSATGSPDTSEQD